MIKTTTVVLLGYDEKTETGEYTNGVSYDIVASNEAEAVEIAKKLYEKPKYLLKGLVDTYKREDEPSYTVFFVACYTKFEKTPNGTTYFDHVGLQVMAETGAEAIERAKTITDKPFYRITDVIQK